MHAWTMVTDAPVSRGTARAKNGKDRRRAGDGGFPGSGHQLRATTMVRCIKWADGPAKWFTGLCPMSLGMADDNGRTTRMADKDGGSRKCEIAIKPHTKCHVI